jgi:hypothetical protein
MPHKTKTVGALTLGGVLMVGAIVGLKLLGGPDLTGLLTDESQIEERASVGVAPRDMSRSDTPPPAGPSIDPPREADEAAIRALIDNEVSGEMVELRAEVVKLLPDDTDGARHQRLLLKLATGGTVLVSHNIDLAERVPAEEGDWLTVFGQYEWNEKGGVLHWTHHDPQNWREGGWIEHDGVRYE